MENPMKKKLQSHLPVLGLSVMIPSIQLVEMAGLLGYDWVLLDCEHGSLNLETVEAMIVAAEANHITPIVRPYKNDLELIGQYMDRGAKGIQAPHVSNAEEAYRIVQAVKYPPMGTRSVAVGTRAAKYGFQGSMAEYTQKSNSETLICVQIEDRAALEHIETIAAVEGVDVCFIGPSDLSQSLGYPGESSHPLVKPVIDNAIQRIVQTGKIAGTAGNIELTQKRLTQGVRYYYTHLTTLLSFASSPYLKHRTCIQPADEVQS